MKKASGALKELTELYDGHLSMTVYRTRWNEDETQRVEAHIRDDLGPAIRSEGSSRHPMYFITQVVVSALKDAIIEGREQSVTVTELEDRTLEIRVPRPNFQNVLVAIVDPQQSWRATRGQVLDENGALMHEYTAQYQEAAPGIWLPKRGTMRNPSIVAKDGRLTTMEWEFEVTRAVVNVDEPDESVYKVNLPPGTIVTDHRYGTTYVVGSDSVYSEHVGRLARLAGESQ